MGKLHKDIALAMVKLTEENDASPQQAIKVRHNKGFQLEHCV